jgi:hypothetical protein
MKKLFFFVFFLLITNVYGQIPTRLIVNSGFEQPSLGCTNCFNLFPDGNVPGWKTTDPTAVIEIWGTNFQSKTSHSGLQFAEINANNSAFLYQELCLAPNEVVNYSIWYLKRTTNTEQMRAQLTELNNTVISQSVIYTATNTWTNYTGTLTNNGTGGLKKIGFVAVTGGSTGNLIDDITISLKPIISIKGFVPTKQYENSSTNLVLLINGTLTNSATINLNLTGTASYPNDFTIGTPSRGSLTINSGNITLTLAAGDYDPNLNNGTTRGEISIPISTLTDGISETDETIIYSISNVSGGGTTFPIVAGLNGYGANCSTYTGSAIDTIMNYSPLPIELIYFNGEQKDNVVELKWITATEINNDFFSIYSSEDINHINLVGQVQGSGNSNFLREYNYIDYNPKKYYRICQTDYDGRSECFDWISIVNFKKDSKLYRIYDVFGRKSSIDHDGVLIFVDENGRAKKIIIKK